jgi:ubiquinone/menaquinone biosynthesis C-methylase UbiE
VRCFEPNDHREIAAWLLWQGPQQDSEHVIIKRFNSWRRDLSVHRPDRTPAAETGHTGRQPGAIDSSQEESAYARDISRLLPDREAPGEIDRLHIQSDALAPDTSILLDRIGVRPGWRCIDLGCGPRGITDLLRMRVGSAGRVVGLDADAVFLDHARQHAISRGFSNVEYVPGDVYGSGLPAASFDLVHTRFVASTIGNPERLLQEAVRLTRPGGIVAFQEANLASLNCYPAHPSWERLKRAFAVVFPYIGGDPWSAHDLYRLLRQSGLEGVQYRPFLVGFAAGEPMCDYLPATMESIRSALIEKHLIIPSELDATIAECRAHLADPGTVSTYLTVVQVWGTSHIEPR